jgi:hypothetical protein
MPILPPDPPAEVDAVARESINNLIQRRQLHVSALARVDPAAVALSTPHPVYNLGLDDLVADRPPAESSLTGWRYLISVANRVVANGEVATEPGGANPRFSSVNQGPFDPAIETALGRLASSGGATEHSVRLLRIPALYMMALWLHSDDQDDRYQPLPPAPPPLRADESYSWSEFRQALLQQAQDRLEFDDSPQT